MTIQHTQQEGRLTVKPEGRLDTLTAPEFEKEVKALLGDAASVEIDLSGVDYVSSAGLRALLSLHKACAAQKADMEVLNVAPAVMDVFSMTGFDKVLHLA